MADNVGEAYRMVSADECAHAQSVSVRYNELYFGGRHATRQLACVAQLVLADVGAAQKKKQLLRALTALV